LAGKRNLKIRHVTNKVTWSQIQIQTSVIHDLIMVRPTRTQGAPPPQLTLEEAEKAARKAKKKKTPKRKGTDVDADAVDPPQLLQLTPDQLTQAIAAATEKAVAQAVAKFTGAQEKQTPPPQKKKKTVQEKRDAEVIPDGSDDEEDERWDEYNPDDYEGKSPTKSSFQIEYEKMENKKCITLDLHVEKEVKKQVLEGKYVELHLLLPPLLGEFTKDKKMVATTEIDGENIKFKNVCEKRKLYGPAHWNEAFRVLTFIEVKAHPSKAAPMLQYAHNINVNFRSNTFESTYQYDQEFRRMIAAGKVVSWASSAEGARNVLVQKQREPFKAKADWKRDDSHRRSGDGRPRDTQASNDRPTGKRNEKKEEKTCKPFNLGTCSYGDACTFPHECYHCRGGHRVKDCPKKKKSRYPSQ